MCKYNGNESSYFDPAIVTRMHTYGTAFHR